MWFVLLLHLALLSTLKSDVKHLFDISCMTGCTILLGVCAPRKLNPPNLQEGQKQCLHFYQALGSRQHFGDGSAPWPALCKGREAAKAKHWLAHKAGLKC